MAFLQPRYATSSRFQVQIALKTTAVAEGAISNFYMKQRHSFESALCDTDFGDQTAYLFT